MEIGISAIGTAVPAFVENQSEFCQFLIRKLELDKDSSRRLQAIYRGTGIKKRHTVINETKKHDENYNFFSKNFSDSATTHQRMQLYKENALPLALSAIENCVSNSPVDLNQITQLITVSCTGMYAPGLDIEIIQKLKLSPNIQRTAVNFMGCYGVFNALKLAQAFAAANPKAKILIVSVELCSIHFKPPTQTMDDLISAAIFSDGAAALVIESQPKQAKFLSLTDFHCDILSKSQDAMAWNIANHGFDIVLSSFVPALIESGIANFADKLIKKIPLHKVIDYYAIHPGGYKILQACDQALKLNPDDNRYSLSILKNYGNMSSATIVFVLKEIWNEIKKDCHNKNIFCLAFGPGLTLESMMLKIHYD